MAVPIVVQSAVSPYSSVSPPWTVSLPALATAGNLIVVQLYGANSPSSGPAGFSTKRSDGSGNGQANLYYKIADGSEQTFSVAGSASSSGVVTAIEFSGIDSVSPIGPTAFGTGSTGAVAPSPTVTPTQPSLLLIHLGIAIATVGTFGTPAGMTLVKQGSTTAAASPKALASALYTLALPDNSPTGTHTTTYSGTTSGTGTNTGQSYLIQAPTTPYVPAVLL